jgi:hypothetical protein
MLTLRPGSLISTLLLPKAIILYVTCECVKSVLSYYGRALLQGEGLKKKIYADFGQNCIIRGFAVWVRHVKGYKIGYKELNIVRYAEDSVLTADNENNLERLLRQFSWCQKNTSFGIRLKKAAKFCYELTL